MAFLFRFLRDCKTLVIPLLAVIVADVFVYRSFGYLPAYLFSMLASTAVVLANVFWIAYSDPKKKWPKLGPVDRLKRLVMFRD